MLCVTPGVACFDRVSPNLDELITPGIHISSEIRSLLHTTEDKALPELIVRSPVTQPRTYANWVRVNNAQIEGNAHLQYVYENTAAGSVLRGSYVKAAAHTMIPSYIDVSPAWFPEQMMLDLTS